MDHLSKQRPSRQVAIWLLVGAGMIVIQILLGGITRLTESGLSITEWKPITGALPPLNEGAWQTEFDKYKLTDQFKYVHQHFSLSDFKFIFFWEWFHRLWARLMGLVFLVGFIYFLTRKKFERTMVKPIAVLFLLGALQGAIGWIMVKSGLVPERYFVGHIELATHFIAALGLLGYTIWFALQILVRPGQFVLNAPLKKFLMAISILLVLQLVYGAFMAGLKAGPVAPTWPDINGNFIPPEINNLDPWFKNLVANSYTIQFIHRGLAYLLFILILTWWYRARAIKGNILFSRFRTGALLLVTLQIVLGVLTVLNATYPNRLVLLGVSHQFVAMLLLAVMMCLLFLTRRNSHPGSIV